VRQNNTGASICTGGYDQQEYGSSMQVPQPFFTQSLHLCVYVLYIAFFAHWVHHVNIMIILFKSTTTTVIMWVRIVVTQPRRISAVSVAERIATERGEHLGKVVGYQIRLEARKSSETRLLLLTTGVLLRNLQVEGGLKDISHIFVDEVHERDINTDFLLIVLKQLLFKHAHLKVVLMSATIHAGIFSKFFESFSCGTISVPGRLFPVTTFHLEHVLEMTVSGTCTFNRYGA
jgi:hypothetical protein